MYCCYFCALHVQFPEQGLHPFKLWNPQWSSSVKVHPDTISQSWSRLLWFSTPDELSATEHIPKMLQLQLYGCPLKDLHQVLLTSHQTHLTHLRVQPKHWHGPCSACRRRWVKWLRIGRNCCFTNRCSSMYCCYFCALHVQFPEQGLHPFKLWNPQWSSSVKVHPDTISQSWSRLLWLSTPDELSATDDISRILQLQLYGCPLKDLHQVLLTSHQTHLTHLRVQPKHGHGPCSACRRRWVRSDSEMLSKLMLHKSMLKHVLLLLLRLACSASRTGLHPFKL